MTAGLGPPVSPSSLHTAAPGSRQGQDGSWPGPAAALCGYGWLLWPAVMIVAVVCHTLRVLCTTLALVILQLLRACLLTVGEACGHCLQQSVSHREKQLSLPPSSYAPASDIPTS